MPCSLICRITLSNISVQMQINTFIFLSVTIINLKVKYRLFVSKNITYKYLSTANHAETEHCGFGDHFCFAYLKMKDTEDRVLSDLLLLTNMDDPC